MTTDQLLADIRRITSEGQTPRSTVVHGGSVRVPIDLMDNRTPGASTTGQLSDAASDAEFEAHKQRLRDAWRGPQSETPSRPVTPTADGAEQAWKAHKAYLANAWRDSSDPSRVGDA